MDHLALWTHALAALCMAAVAFLAARGPAAGLPRWPIVATYALGAIWALANAGLGAGDPATRLLAGIHALSLLGVMALLHRRAAGAPLGLVPIYGVVAALIVVTTLLQLLALSLGLTGRAGTGVATAALLLRMLATVAALVLVNNIAMARPTGAVRLICASFATLWAADLAIVTVAYVSSDWPAAVGIVRGALVMAAAAIAGLALHRGDVRPVAVSRTVAYRSLSLVAVGVYLAALAFGTSALSALEDARIWQTAYVLGLTAATLTLLSSSWLRAWAKVKIAKHLFTHRYDYRAEWLRFTGTLGTADAVAAPLAERIVKAVADLTMSDRGLLMVPEGEGLGIGAAWNWDVAGRAADACFVRHMTRTERILALDELRRPGGDAEESAAVPQWMIDDVAVWAAVPMLHHARLVGVVVLSRPEVDRALDWEDFDLLKAAGRQVASYLAEARAQEALADTQRFDEFNRRTAFIVHDIKNLVSGLSLVARNAERHADNPEFRADMVATLQDSAAKLSLLLGRLSAGPRGRSEPPVPVPLLDFARTVVARRRAGHPVVATGDAQAIAFVDPGRLDQIVDHLLSNAVEASPATEPVTLVVSSTATDATIAIVDRGCGMSPAFIRDRLFRPFASSKPAGFGIGAFEARQLAESQGGRIAVDSREGEGSTFRVILPIARVVPFEVAA